MKFALYSTFAAVAAAAHLEPAYLKNGVSYISELPTTGKVQFAGVNIAGFDFGCDINGTCNLASAFDVVSKGNGIAQMSHFTKNSGLNAFRLPVGWQFLLNNEQTPGGPIDATNLAAYDGLVRGCLDSGSKACIVDVHNYARFNGGIIGQGGPANEVLVNLWTQLATHYANESRIVFGVMNEPHDIPNIVTWAQTVQEVVTAIRKAGAMTQMIIMPGNNFTSAAAFVENGSGAALMNVTNPDGTIDNLFFDVHRYLDADNSGTHTECVTNNIDGAFTPLATFLRMNGRRAFLTETGGGNTASCLQFLCEQLAFINKNSDVYLGWIGWAAGGFDQTYELVETPIQGNGTLTDTSLVKQCVAGQFVSPASG
ncbi:glycoside hydrolase family 5 protein [Glonium stellatum]|uniref:Endoglucanase EG-II n=1 Tax=Glonium stellatum TaxID=574774 RepID=A0A8E2FFU9_9PEZI|nr:glycoside hydrolase family 5 protein [Glonium stellatum]